MKKQQPCKKLGKDSRDNVHKIPREKMVDLLKFPVVKLNFNPNSFLSTLSHCVTTKSNSTILYACL